MEDQSPPPIIDCNSPFVSNDNLEQGKLVYRRHFIELIWPTILTISMILLIVIFSVLIFSSEAVDIETYLPYIILFDGVLTFLAISYFFMNWTFWYLDIWVVTEGRLIDSQLVTFFVHQRSELALEQIQDIRFTIPGTLAAIFNCGHILIQSAAKESNFTLMFIPNPGKVIKEITGALCVAKAKMSHTEHLDYHEPENS